MLPLLSAFRLPLPVAWCLPSLFYVCRCHLPCAFRCRLPFVCRCHRQRSTKQNVESERRRRRDLPGDLLGRNSGKPLENVELHRLTLPAAAAASPEKIQRKRGSEVEKNDVKKTKRERDDEERENAMKRRNKCFANIRGRAHRTKTKNASFSSLFSSERANPTKTKDLRAPAKDKCAP